MERERENRRAEERNREEGGKDEGRGRGNARGGGEKVSRKGERRRGRWRRRQQHTKTRERGEEGRDRREEGRCTAQKLEGGSVPSDIMTGGAQGSDERGDRTAGERQNGGQVGQKGGTRRKKGRDRDRTDKRGKCVAVKKEAKELRHPISPFCTCRAANCVCAVGDGWSCT